MKALSLTIQKLWPMLKLLQTNKWTNKQMDRETNGQTDKQTERPKTICPPSIDARHNNIHAIA